MAPLVNVPDRLLYGSVLVESLSLPSRRRTTDAILNEIQSDPSYWTVTSATAADLAALSKRDLRAFLARCAANELRQNVLVIHDYTPLLINGGLDWSGEFIETALDAVAKNQHHGRTDDTNLRFVLGTVPRDRDLKTPNSELRANAERLAAPPLSASSDEAIEFGFDDLADMIECCGGDPNVLPHHRNSGWRSSAAKTFRRTVPQMVGRLDAAGDELLGRTLGKDPKDRRFKPGHAYCWPLVNDLGGRCIVGSQATEIVVSMCLMATTWRHNAVPGAPLRSSVARLVARVGDDRAPLWADRFIGLPEIAASPELSTLIEHTIRDLEPDASMRVLSPTFIQGSPVNRTVLSEAVANIKRQPGVGDRLEWRLFDARDEQADLHERELVLPHRRQSFRLPPVDRILGVTLWADAPRTNSSDARRVDEVDKGISDTEQIWTGAQPI